MAKVVCYSEVDPSSRRQYVGNVYEKATKHAKSFHGVWYARPIETAPSPLDHCIPKASPR